MKKVYKERINPTYIKEKKTLKLQFLPIDILLVVLATILCLVFVIVPVLNGTVVRVVLGIPLILFLPGYSLIAALFPKKNDLESIERIILSFGLSIVVTPIIGLLMNYTFGITLTPLLLSLSLFTILMNFIAYIRRWKVPFNERFTIKFSNHLTSITGIFKYETKIDKFISVALILSIILAVSMSAYAATTPIHGEKFTEFYILGENGKTSDYPTNLGLGERGNVLIGVINHENTQTNYHMVIQLNGKTITEKNISLAAAEKWQNNFTFNGFQKGKNQKLDFLLYKLPDNNNIYRSLHLRVNIN